MKDTRSQSIGVLSRILGVSTDSETNRKLLGDAVDEITVILREDPTGPPIVDCPASTDIFILLCDRRPFPRTCTRCLTTEIHPGQLVTM